MTPLQNRTIEVARRLVGEKEATGNNDGWLPRFLQRWAASGAAWLDEQPWCVMFVTWCVHKAGSELGRVPAIPKEASSSRLYSWAKANKQLRTGPEAGCIGLVRKGGQGDSDRSDNAGKTHIHAFIVEEVLPSGQVKTIEGNFRNAVCRNTRPVDGIDWMRVS